MLSASLHLARFRGDSRFSTWVTRIATNEALMLLRQRRANTQLSDASYEDAESPFVRSLADGAPTPDLGLTVAAVKARVFHARRWLRCRLERKLKTTGNGVLIEV